MDELILEIVSDLTIELTTTDPMFDADILEVKVKSAVREVKNARNYPDYYTDSQIASDLEQFYAQIREIALYDYNQIGIEFQSNHTEADTQRTYIDRYKLFKGILPYARC